MTTLTAGRSATRSSHSLLGTLLHWAAVAKTRKDLANLDAAALRDLGLTRQDVKTEASRDFWDAPTSWKRG